jgi:hypothetical protein
LQGTIFLLSSFLRHGEMINGLIKSLQIEADWRRGVGEFSSISQAYILCVLRLSFITLDGSYGVRKVIGSEDFIVQFLAVTT